MGSMNRNNKTIPTDTVYISQFKIENLIYLYIEWYCMAEHDITTYLEANPRMIGVLFTIMVLLSQAGSVAGAYAVGTSGP